MALWKLEPLDTTDHNWKASTFKSEVIVRAPDSRMARLLASRAFGIAPERVSAGTIPVVPWDEVRLVGCEEVEPTENYAADGDSGIVYPADAVERASPGYEDL